MSSEPLPATVRVASARRLAFGSALVAAAALALSLAGSLGTYFWVAVGSALAGHLGRAHVRPTLEVILTEAPAHLRKRLDPESGLALIDMHA